MPRSMPVRTRRSRATERLVQGGGTASFLGAGTTTVKGSTLSLNSGGQPVARLGDAVTVDPLSGAGVITGGSTTVNAG